HGKSAFMGTFTDCEPYLNNIGYMREPFESFSNLAMRFLNDFDTTRMNDDEQILADISTTKFQRKEKHNHQELGNVPSDFSHLQCSNDPITEKDSIVNKSNEFYIDLGINFGHICTLLRRKFKIYFTSIQNVVLLVINFAMLLIAIKFFGSLFVNDNRLPQNLREERNYFLKLTFLPFIFSAIPIVAGSAFYPEIDQVKREIGVSIYSVLSYYIASLIQELVIYLCSLIMFLVGTYIYYPMNAVSYAQLMWPGLLIFLGSLLFYMFLGTISKSKKMTIFLLGFSFFFNMSAVSEFVNFLYRCGMIGKSAWLCLFDVFPSYLISSIIKTLTPRNNIFDDQIMKNFKMMK
ncbi:ATP-binding cassette superfamily, partial [Pseudoloma neurophilia]